MKFSIDDQLKEKLNKWHEQIEILKRVEETYLHLEANEKALFAKLFLAADGKNVSEREALAFSHGDWKDFKAGQAEAKASYLHEKRILELKMKAYEAAYLTYKVEAEAVRRG